MRAPSGPRELHDRLVAAEVAVDVDLGGVGIRVCSLEALLKMKRESSRPRDREDLEALEIAHSSEEDAAR